MTKLMKIIKNLYKSKKSKNKKFQTQINIKTIKKYNFLISSTKKIFNYLKQIFIKALIIQHLD